jgi:pyridoxal phosphate enzyme (YggS family)
MIRDNLFEVEQNIRSACESVGRSRENLTLIAVSKTKPVEMLKEAYDCGVRDFGENKVQELIEKIPQMPNDVRWHMIGHLQRNKVKQIIGKVFLIHGVDSFALAEEIEKQSAAKNVITDILIQVNISGEESKFGVSPEAVSDLVNRILTLAHVRIKGFMTIPPFVDDPEENRCHFQNLRQLSVDINAKNIDNSDMNFLSMGMTGDYCVAAQEGATYLRVGTGIFGERDYANHTTASK